MTEYGKRWKSRLLNVSFLGLMVVGNCWGAEIAKAASILIGHSDIDLNITLGRISILAATAVCAIWWMKFHEHLPEAQSLVIAKGEIVSASNPSTAEGNQTAVNGVLDHTRSWAVSSLIIAATISIAVFAPDAAKNENIWTAVLFGAIGIVLLMISSVLCPSAHARKVTASIVQYASDIMMRVTHRSV